MNRSPGRLLVKRATAIGCALLVAVAALPVVLAATAAPAAAAVPNLTWTQPSAAGSVPLTAFASMAFDPAAGTMVFFGGTMGGDGSHGCPQTDQTWTSNGSTWTERSPATSPTARLGASMAFDPNSGQVVLFGGWTGNCGTTETFGDTWTWDGTTWTEVTPPTAPTARYGASMAYDPGLGELVLFGGNPNTGTALDDTWTFDGTTWTELAPSTAPSTRWYSSMAYDQSAGRMVLFGGCAEEATDNGCNSFLGDTWTFDGTTWTDVSPTPAPAVRYAASMAFDPLTGRTFLFGGRNSTNGSLGDTWTFDGTTWTELSPTTSPDRRYAAAMAFDQDDGSMLLVAGDITGSGDDVFDPWVWAPSAPVVLNWSEASPPTSPSARVQAAITGDALHRTVVLFGGQDASGGVLDDTWIWDGTTWTQVFPATSPPARYAASMAFDPANGTVVLFGGTGTGGNARSDLWVWDGTTWTELFPFSGYGNPEARSGAAMTFDASIGQVVLFGGVGFGTYLDDTWTWDGSTWTPVTPATVPPARASATMAFDPGAGSVVLFSGVDASGTQLADTWTLTGTTWAEVSTSPTDRPESRVGATMAFDPVSGTVVLFGGLAFDGFPLDDTWAWDGTAWTEQFPVDAPSYRAGAAMTFDPTTYSLLLFGGSGGSAASFFDDTWVYSLLPAPTVTAISPDTGSTEGGTRLVVWGTGFAPGASGGAGVAAVATATATRGMLEVTVTVGGVPCAPVVVVAPTELTCTTGPNDEGPADVIVTVAGMRSSGGDGRFTHVGVPAPNFTG